MNAMNTIINDQLKHAMAALHHLDDAGCTVLHVALGERKPLIAIDAPSDFLRGALKSRVTLNGVQRIVMATTVHGCQVEWNETHHVAAKAVRS